MQRLVSNNDRQEMPRNLVKGNGAPLARTLLLSLALLVGLTCCGDSRDPNEIVEVRLVGVGTLEHTLLVPRKFIGPGRLELAEEGKRGGKIKILPLALTFPALEPWSATSDVEAEGERRLFILLSLSKARGTLSYIQFLKLHTASTPVSFNQELRFSYFEELSPTKNPFIRIRNFFSETEQFLVRCRDYLSIKNEPKCELHFDLGSNVSVRLRGWSWNDRDKWRDVRARVMSLLKTFETNK
jgi:hypothetical protein